MCEAIQSTYAILSKIEQAQVAVFSNGRFRQPLLSRSCIQYMRLPPSLFEAHLLSSSGGDADTSKLPYADSSYRSMPDEADALREYLVVGENAQAMREAPSRSCIAHSSASLSLLIYEILRCARILDSALLWDVRFVSCLTHDCRRKRKKSTVLLPVLNVRQG